MSASIRPAMKALRQRFGTIRWKLTGTFVLVSLLLALTLITILVAVIVWALNSTLILQALVELARQEAVTLRPALESPERSSQQLEAQLRTMMADLGRNLPVQADGATRQLPGVAPTAASGGTNLSAELAVVALLGSDGRVITTTLPAVYPFGALLADLEPAAARAIIAAGTRGVTDSVRLATWNDPAHEPLVAAPILGRDGHVLRVLYMRFTALPSTGIILASLPPLLLTFIIPWLGISGGIGILYAWVASRGFSRRLKRLTEASATLARGDLTRRVEDRSADEIGQLARQFNTMADQLAENMRALRLLVDQNMRLAEQAAQLATVEERNRLARDLHDSVSQELFSLTMLAAAARRVIERDPALAAAQIEEIEVMARQSLQETRGLIFALRPAMLNGRGLGPALRDLAAAARERQGLEVDLSISGERGLPLDQEQALFRIVQEALANVVRHSGERAAQVVLRYEEAQTCLTIRDQGCGFDPAAPRNARSIGLDSMAERASALGGALSIESALGQGTTLRVSIPAPTLT